MVRPSLNLMVARVFIKIFSNSSLSYFCLTGFAFPKRRYYDNFFVKVKYKLPIGAT